MQVTGTNIYMTRGDSECIGVRVSGYTLKEGDFVEFTMRRSVDSPVQIHKKSTEIKSDNSFVIPILPEDTETLQFGNYVYDIQATFSGSVKTIVRPSKFTIGDEVTYGL